MAQIVFRNGKPLFRNGQAAANLNCCCSSNCCCVNGVIRPSRMSHSECENLGGTVVDCSDYICECPECVPTVTVNGIEFPMNSPFFVITSICDRTVPFFGFPDTFNPLCVTGKIDTITAWGAAYSYYDCLNSFVYVEVWHVAHIQCDKGWQTGDLKVNTDLLVDNATWERRWRFYFQGEPETGALCWTGEGGPPLITVEIEDTQNNFDLNDFSDLAAESQECHDLLLTEPEISITCGSEEDLPAC